MDKHSESQRTNNASKQMPNKKHKHINSIDCVTNNHITLYFRVVYLFITHWLGKHLVNATLCLFLYSILFVRFEHGTAHSHTTYSITNYRTSLSINFLWRLWLFGTHSPSSTNPYTQTGVAVAALHVCTSIELFHKLVQRLVFPFFLQTFIFPLFSLIKTVQFRVN